MEREPTHQVIPPIPKERGRFVLSNEIYSAICELAEIQGLSLADAVRVAIGRTLFLDREAAEGSKILLSRPKMRELVI